MPGYVGIGEKDRPVLLGNGGADMTAIYVAQQLGVKALLLKDIDGVYEHDPRESGPAPMRYAAISWDDAIERAGPLVASKALEYAKSNALEFDIGTIGVPVYTTVGAQTSSPSKPPVVKPLRVAMLGCGVVGGGVLRRIKSMTERFTMVKIMVRNVEKYIAEGVDPALLTADFDDVLAAEPDVFKKGVSRASKLYLMAQQITCLEKFPKVCPTLTRLKRRKIKALQRQTRPAMLMAQTRV